MSTLIGVRQSGPIGARNIETFILAQGAAFDLSGDIALNTTHRELIAGENPHNTLPNVTNDSQLKRAANDFTAFTERTSPQDADPILCEDSGAAGVKKWLSLGTLKTFVLNAAALLFQIINARDDHGTIAGPINISGLFTQHTGDFVAGFTATLLNFMATSPATEFTFTVSGGGTPTMVLSAPAPVDFWTTQTLSLLPDGDYRAVILYNGARFGVYVDLL